jgi:hypothetical protein
MATVSAEKKRTTIYIAEDVLEYLAIRRAKGAGSVSQQLEDLARKMMPVRPSGDDVARMEARDVEGYKKQPLEPDEFEPWQDEQVWDEA